MITKSFTTTLVAGMLSSAAHAASTVSYSVDSTGELTGSFEFDYIADPGLGGGTTIANFPHFHISLAPPESYTPGSSYFEVELGSGPTIDLRGVDLSFPSFSTALAQYDTSAGVLASYPDIHGSFTSPFDGATTIEYSYTNVGEISQGIFAGDFSFNAVPEPSSAACVILGLSAFLGVRRKRA